VDIPAALFSHVADAISDLTGANKTPVSEPIWFPQRFDSPIGTIRKELAR
jgi:hypothetical protein